MGKAIDLNCDMGESFGIYKIGNDQEMIKHVTSISMGCGFHAGDPHVMRETVALAKKYGVAVGAHPGYPDLIGFGRRKMEISLLCSKTARAQRSYCPCRFNQKSKIKIYGITSRRI